MLLFDSGLHGSCPALEPCGQAKRANDFQYRSSKEGSRNKGGGCGDFILLEDTTLVFLASSNRCRIQPFLSSG